MIDTPTAYAHAVLSNGPDPRPAIDWQPLWTDAEWRSAAQTAIDGDASDLRWMHFREEAYQAFQQYQSEDDPRREFEDFGNWLCRNAGLYRAAMTAHELRSIAA